MDWIVLGLPLAPAGSLDLYACRLLGRPCCWDHRAVLLAYVDESGDTGDPALGGSFTYCLGCVLVDADAWPAAFDELVQLRRRLKAHFGLKVRDEVKANFLLRGSGPLRALHLGPRGHFVIYRAHLQTLEKMLDTRAFAIVVDKRVGRWISKGRTFDLAWEGLASAP